MFVVKNVCCLFVVSCLFLFVVCCVGGKGGRGGGRRGGGGGGGARTASKKTRTQPERGWELNAGVVKPNQHEYGTIFVRPHIPGAKFRAEPLNLIFWGRFAKPYFPAPVPGKTRRGLAEMHRCIGGSVCIEFACGNG